MTADLDVTTPPVVETWGGVLVVRDDLVPGGTKARFAGRYFANVDHVICPTTPHGGSQVAVAVTAKRLGKQATIVCYENKTRHPRTAEAQALGARIVPLKFGRHSYINATANALALETPGSMVSPFGLGSDAGWEVVTTLAKALPVSPRQVWCGVGSGFLLNALAAAWPQASCHGVVPPGCMPPSGTSPANVHYHKAQRDSRDVPPMFPADQYYERPAWNTMMTDAVDRGVTLDESILFWNVQGPWSE